MSCLELVLSMLVCKQNANHKKQEFGVYVHHSLFLLRMLLILTGSWHTSLVLFVHIISWSSESGMQPLVRFCNFPAMKNQPPGNLIQIYHLNYKAFNTIGQLKSFESIGRNHQLQVS
jgi:hypothetical protein